MLPFTSIWFLLASLFLPFLVGGWTAKTDASEKAANIAQQPTANQAKIPPAPSGCETAECQWWEQLRVAAADVEQAYIQKEKEIAEVTRNAPRATNIIGSPPILPPDFPDFVARLDADIQRAVTHFHELITRGSNESLPIPVIENSINRPIFIHLEKGRYTEEARAAKVQGTVILSLKFQPDGTMTDINVVQGLEGGLNEAAIIAVRKIVFLPVVKNGKFVSVSHRMEIKFRLY